jgi:hypothetical protein
VSYGGPYAAAPAAFASASYPYYKPDFGSFGSWGTYGPYGYGPASAAAGADLAAESAYAYANAPFVSGAYAAAPLGAYAAAPLGAYAAAPRASCRRSIWNGRRWVRRYVC